MGATILWQSLAVAVALAYATPALAQSESLYTPDEADRLDIQEPGIRTFGTVGLDTRLEERDILLKRGMAAHIGAGVAYWGFSGSYWIAKNLESGEQVGEFLLGYSYKLPVVDAHGGFVVCANEILPKGCSDSVRLTLTTNAIAKTTIEANVDLALADHRHVTSLAVTRDIFSAAGVAVSGRLGWTQDKSRQDRYEAISARLIADVPLRKNIALDLVAGRHWNLKRGAASLPEASMFAALSLVMRR